MFIHHRHKDQGFSTKHYLQACLKLTWLTSVLSYIKFCIISTLVSSNDYFIDAIDNYYKTCNPTFSNTETVYKLSKCFFFAYEMMIIIFFY